MTAAHFGDDGDSPHDMAYDDLRDLGSTLSELPAGRSEVTTMVIARDATPDWVRGPATGAEDGRRGQAFIVCPQITPTVPPRKRRPLPKSEEMSPAMSRLFEEACGRASAGVRVECCPSAAAEPRAGDAPLADGRCACCRHTVIEVGSLAHASMMVLSDATDSGSPNSTAFGPDRRGSPPVLSAADQNLATMSPRHACGAATRAGSTAEVTGPRRGGRARIRQAATSA